MSHNTTAEEPAFFSYAGISNFFSNQVQSVKNWYKLSNFGIGVSEFFSLMGRKLAGSLVNSYGFGQKEFLVELAKAARTSLQDPNAKDFPMGITAKDGVSQRSFGYKVFGVTVIPPFFTFQSFSGKENLKKFSDIKEGGRGFYDPPRNLAQIDNFVGLPLDRDKKGGSRAIEEKKAIKSYLRTDDLRLWLVTKNMCRTENMLELWDESKPISYNLNMLANRIVCNGKFAKIGLPNDIDKLIEDFEHRWHHPEDFEHESVLEFIQNSRENREKFIAISRQLNQQDPSQEADNPYLPELKDHPELKITEDINQVLYDHHKSTHFLRTKNDINTAGFLAIFGNLPKLITGTGMMILSNPELCAILKKEIEKIDSEDVKYKDGYPEEAKDYAPHFPKLDSIMNSEVFFRCYVEVFRYWFNPPFIPRINSSLLSSFAVDPSKGKSMPPRSVSFHADSLLEREGFEHPEEFNPFREEYKFKRSSSGHLMPDCEKVLEMLRGFNHEGSMRICPGKRFSYIIFCQLVYQWLKNDYHLEADFEKLMKASKTYQAKDKEALEDDISHLLDKDTGRLTYEHTSRLLKGRVVRDEEEMHVVDKSKVGNGL